MKEHKPGGTEPAVVVELLFEVVTLLEDAEVWGANNGIEEECVILDFSVLFESIASLGGVDGFGGEANEESSVTDLSF